MISIKDFLSHVTAISLIVACLVTIVCSIYCAIKLRQIDKYNRIATNDIIPKFEIFFEEFTKAITQEKKTGGHISCVCGRGFDVGDLPVKCEREDCNFN